ncbi:MAG: family 16 glycosylhydrolase [Oligoflexales bacterium]|nr:family 16 glycosylhydrolase [Oligoflexales bacterium]
MLDKCRFIMLPILAHFALGGCRPVPEDGGSHVSFDGPSANTKIFYDNFDQNSCLSGTNEQSRLSAGSLVLSMNDSLITKTALSYGRYTMKMKSGIAGGSVMSFYIMGVPGHLRENEKYFSLHDEVDFEFVTTLWRQGRYIADNVTWINAYHHHRDLILPVYNDLDGGSILRYANKNSEIDPGHLREQILSPLVEEVEERAFDFNDGEYHSYIIDYSKEKIQFIIMDADEKQTIARHTIYKKDISGNRWPETTMYLAISFWYSNDADTQNYFTGPLNLNLTGSSKAYIDSVKYETSDEKTLAALSDWGTQMPWDVCRPSVSTDCSSYNRDGKTCDEVGYAEGQTGEPWGIGNGFFQCVNGCLKWIRQ